MIQPPRKDRHPPTNAFDPRKFQSYQNQHVKQHNPYLHATSSQATDWNRNDLNTWLGQLYLTTVIYEPNAYRTMEGLSSKVVILFSLLCPCTLSILPCPLLARVSFSCSRTFSAYSEIFELCGTCTNGNSLGFQLKTDFKHRKEMEQDTPQWFYSQIPKFFSKCLLATHHMYEPSNFCSYLRKLRLPVCKLWTVWF